MRLSRELDVPTATGYAVPLTHYPAPGAARARLLFLPALGLRASFYKTFGEVMAAAGVDCFVMELRGQGRSSLRASRRCDYGFRETLADDLPAVRAWLQDQHPGTILLGGHSLGGHYSAMAAAGLPGLRGVLLVATGSPWIGAFRGRTRRQLRLLCALIPALHALLGYFPGEQLGFGGRDGRRLMRDWRHLALHNEYRAEGLAVDFEAAIRAVAVPVLAIHFEADDYAPVAAVRALTDRFRSPLRRQCLDAAQLGERADHFRWARRPQALVEHVLDWLPP